MPIFILYYILFTENLKTGSISLTPSSLWELPNRPQSCTQSTQRHMLHMHTSSQRATHKQKPLWFDGLRYITVGPPSSLV